jgi:hypothetical protein
MMTHARSKTCRLLFVALLHFILLRCVLAASIITFDEPGIVPGVTTDPGFTLRPVTFVGTGCGTAVFSAGDPSLLMDTFVDDSTGRSGSSLANGFVGLDSVINLRVSGTPVAALMAWFNIQSVFDSAMILEGYDSLGRLVASSRVVELAGDPAWVHSISISAAGGMSWFQFRDEFGGSLFNIDDVSITLVPEPGTLLLALSGLIPLVVWRVRRV